MNYIILDMEWDSSYNKALSRFINQILQIGAVKLDEQLNVIDTFSCNIRSSFTNRVSGRFARLTGITNDVMRSGIPFDDAVDAYNEFAGTDTVTMTWSNSDLYTIIENETNLLKGKHFHFEKYLDLQEYIQNEMRHLGFEITSQISLSNAALLLGINSEDIDLHTAEDDSMLAARILKKHYNKDNFCSYIRDTQNPEFYKKLTYKPHYIDDINSEFVNSSDFVFFCDGCNKRLKRLSNWHFKNRNFNAVHKCPECNKKYIARVSIRKNYDDVTVKRKLTEYVKKEKKDEVQSVPEKV